MDFIDEQHIAFFEVRKDRSKVSRTLDGWTAGSFDVRAQLIGNHGGKGGLAQARGPENRIWSATSPRSWRSLNQDASDSLIFVWPR